MGTCNLLNFDGIYMYMYVRVYYKNAYNTVRM